MKRCAWTGQIGVRNFVLLLNAGPRLAGRSGAEACRHVDEARRLKRVRLGAIHRERRLVRHRVDADARSRLPLL